MERGWTGLGTPGRLKPIKETGTPKRNCAARPRGNGTGRLDGTLNRGAHRPWHGYVTSLHANARVAHIGYPVAACGVTFTGPHRTSEDAPSGRGLCRACARHAVDYGWINSDEADLLIARTPSRDNRPLTGRMVTLLVDGLADREIAHRLGVSQRTVSRHVAEAMDAVGARSRFRWGYRLGKDEPSQVASIRGLSHE